MGEGTVRSQAQPSSGSDNRLREKKGGKERDRGGGENRTDPSRKRKNKTENEN